MVRKQTTGVKDSDIEAIEAAMTSCMLCPRECRVNRLEGQKGYCGETAVLRAARAALHFWEEPCISGTQGSGTVFFTGCPLKCVYCQNAALAAGEAGQEITVERLEEIFLELQEKGANNINLVTPTHFVPQIAAALRLVRDSDPVKGATEEGEPGDRRKLHIPVVYNTSGYEKAETLRMLEGLVDVYLPDLKYLSAEPAAAYSHAPDYAETAKAAIAEMVRQTGEPLFRTKEGTLLGAEQWNKISDGQEEERETKEPALPDDYADMPFLVRGVIVRHLLLPGGLADSRRVLAYLHRTYGNRIYISIMNQYTPMPAMKGHPVLGRPVSKEAYEKLVDYAVDIGIENGFIQGNETAKESFIPVFDCQGILPDGKRRKKSGGADPDPQGCPEASRHK